MMETIVSRDRTLISFGRNVARIRTERGFFQDALAEQADLDRTYMAGIERGVRNPRLVGLQPLLFPKLAKAAQPPPVNLDVEQLDL